MQTFLPFADFSESATVLDRQRLGKQRVETWQLLNALDGKTKGWANHPAALMWRGYEAALAEYGIAICAEWLSRGYKDTMLDRFLVAFDTHSGNLDRPFWLDDSEFHLAHQSNLLRKDPIHYGPLFPGVPDNLPYVWPVSKEMQS